MMTRFMSYFNLSRINDSKDLLGISPDCVKGNLIVTLSRNIIIVVEISSQQKIISWSTQEKLSNKVIYDKRSKKYVGVFGKRFIRCWDASDSDINRIKKYKLQKSVLDIITCEDLGIILYIDGSFDQLSDILSIQKRLSIKPCLLTNPQLKYNNVKNIDVKYLKGTKLLIYFEKNECSEDIDLVMMTLLCAGKQRRFKIRRKDITVKLSGYAIVEGATRFMLLTIWSDHKLFLLNLDEEIDAESLPGNFISVIPTLKVDTPVTIVGVAQNCVAIYGANSNQEGASLLLYNTQFKVVKAQQYFKVYFNYSRIWIADDNIVLAMGQNLSVVSFRMSHDLLVDLLGTYNTAKNIAIEGDFINEEHQMQSFCVLKERELKTTGPSSGSHHSDCKIYMSSGEKIRKFTHSSDMNEIHVNVVHERSLIDDVVNIAELHSENHLLNKSLIEFYIHQLGNCGATEQEISEKLLAIGNKMKNRSHIMNFATQFLCASELVIAKALFCMIIKSSSEPLSKVVSSSTNILEPLTIETIFKPIRKSAFIQNYRKDSSFFLLYIIDYFYRLLTEPSYFKAFRSETCNLRIEMQIFYWFDSLLSAHFQHLVLSREVEMLNVLFKWTKLIIVYKNQMKKLQEVLRLLYNVIQQESNIEKSNTYMWYCIEDLSF